MFICDLSVYSANNMTDKNIFITTTLPYPNSEPHVGFLFEIVLADAINRYLKSKGNKTFFNTGLDEEGLKIYQKALEKNLSPKEYVDGIAPIYIDFLKKFNIEYDRFYRTSSTEHSEKVQTVWSHLVNRGDIYKKEYKGNYCVGCESFKLDKEISNGFCKYHPLTEIEEIEEENYFFKLSNYKEILSLWIKDNTNFLQPQYKIKELTNLIDGVEDISISRLRKNCPWGTEVPNDPNQTIYIWFSALLNYIFSAGYLTDKFNWEYVIQTCGGDNLRFQAIIFQAILQSEGIKKSDKLLVHGIILDNNGRKMSKTLGNVIDPIDQLNKFGVDPVRYYCLSGLSTYSDSSWNSDDLKLKWNSLANGWGNLVSRVLHLTDTIGTEESEPNDLELEVNQLCSDAESLWNEYEIKLAVDKTDEAVSSINRWINTNKPWEKKDPKEIGILYKLLSKINKLYTPVIPDTSKIVEDGIKLRKKIIAITKI